MEGMESGVEEFEFKLPNTREVPEHIVGLVLAKIEKINKRALKLGLEAFVVTKGVPFERKVHGDTCDYMVTYVPVTVEGPKVKIPGHELIGRVDFEDGSNIVSARPGAAMPLKYRSVSSDCDHCKSSRMRNSVVVFKRDADGEHIQVGRSCLKDFMGYAPEAVLWATSAYGSLMEDIDEEISRGAGSAPRKVELARVMAMAAQTVREYGFTSKARAMEKGICASADDVSELLFNPRVYAPTTDRYGRTIPGRVRPTEAEAAADVAKGEAVVAWVLEAWGLEADKSDYEYNAVELCSMEGVAVKRIGLLTSLVAAYDRANTERVERASHVDAYVGAVKQRREFDAEFLSQTCIGTAYGDMWIGRFMTTEGLLVYKGGSPFWDSGMKAGDRIKFKGTVKAHEAYKGAKQTLVARCVLMDEVAA